MPENPRPAAAPPPDEPVRQAAAASPVSSSKPQAKKTAKLLLPAKALGAHIHNKWVYFKSVKLSKKQWALLIVVLLALIAGGVFGGMTLYQHFRGKPPVSTPVVKNAKKAAPAPTTEASTLTGVQVPIGTNKRQVNGFMIENSLDARPQSGLKDAGVVFEAIAEGGITRFLALFQETMPAYIGPVRSARPYYIDWLLGFDATYAHVGGSPEALAKIKALGVKDLDQFANGGSYDRVTSRVAPHNVYTSMDRIDALAASKGYTTSSFTGFERKKDAPAAVVSPAGINIDISSSLFSVHYDYNNATNSYLRSEGGAPHLDEKSQLQIIPKVVVAMVVPYGIEADGQHSEYATIGSGQVYIFQDGSVSVGTWKKTDAKAQITFTDGNGATIKLNAGQTWITAVNSADAIHY